MAVSPRVLLPTRRTYAWLALAAMAFAIYVSLIPFTFSSMPVGQAVRTFAMIITAPVLGRLSRTNFLANLLLFLPVGFGLAGALLADRHRKLATVARAVGLGLAASVMVSLTAEFLQMFAPGRVPSRADVEAQTAGGVLGMAAWLLAGPRLTGWLRAAQTPDATDRVGRALAAYAAAWTLANLAPFDITLDLGELAGRWRSGLINVVPFAWGGRPPGQVAWDSLIAALSAVPLGLLGLTWQRGERGPRSAPVAFAIGAAFVVAMESVQVFIASHAADVNDVLFGCLGVGIGVTAGARLLATVAAADGDSARHWSRMLLGGWGLLLLAYHWMPYDFTFDAATVRGRVTAISLAPFAGYARGSDLNALNDLLVKVGLAMPLGVLAALAPRDPRRTATTAGWAVAATITFTIVEAGQVFLPSRSPDATDVAVGVAGTMAGLWLGRWLRGR